MAYWLEEVVELLWQLTKDDPPLAKKIRQAIKHIEHNPRKGHYVRQTRYVHFDSEGQFRISYNYHPHTREIEIAVLHISQNVKSSKNN